MARPLRVEFPGALYHVMSRGNAKAAVFHCDIDRRDFLDRLDEVGVRLAWKVWCYCLMHTHYHLLVETSLPTLGKGMRQLNSAYAQAFNRRHERVGHVFQGRYKAFLVKHEPHALQVVRYIDRNPIGSGLCADPAEWPWSSHREILGSAEPRAVLAPDRVVSRFGHGDDGRARYRAFVMMAGDDPARLARPNRAILGDQDYVDRISPWVIPPDPEVPRPERVLKSITFYAEQHADRDDAIRAAHATGFHSQVAIARHFGVHYSTVCRIIRSRPGARFKIRPQQHK